MIRKAITSDLDSIYSLLLSCAACLSQKGFHHWSGTINKKKFKQSIANGLVYVLLKDDSIIATMTLSPTAPTYCPDLWPNSDKTYLYLSKLAVLPAHQGRGYALKLLEFAEDLARKSSVFCLRLDCVAHYDQLNKFYLKRGFRYVSTGKINSRNLSSNFYQKQLSS